MKIQTDSIISRSDTVLSSDLDGQIVMLNIETGEYYDIDPIGSDIWNQIEQPKSVNKICNELAQEYAVKVEQCQSDVMKFLNELLSLSAVEIDA